MKFCPTFLFLFLAMIPMKSAKAAAFLDHMFQPIQKPNLSIAADKQLKKQLQIELSIGKPGATTAATMKTPNVKNMIIELHHETFQDSNNEEYHVTLPGADGPNPNLSSGHRRIQVLSRGTLPSNNNIFQLGGNTSRHKNHHLDLIKGCWKMCWRKDVKKLAGTLVCGFETPKDYRIGGRPGGGGGILLPQSTKLYISFPLWTSRDLKDCQNKKRRADRWLQKRDEELNKFDLTDNYLMKVMHLANAFMAVGEYQQQQGQKSQNTHNTALESIPNNDDVVELQKGVLFLARTGMVWSSSSSTDESSIRDGTDEYSEVRRNRHRLLLGVANIISSS